MYIDQRNVIEEEDLRDYYSLDVLVNALQLDLILYFNLTSNDLMKNAKQSKPFDLNLKLLEAQKMSLNRTQLTINAPLDVHLL
jgi:hypothetical protein